MNVMTDMGFNLFVCVMRKINEMSTQPPEPLNPFNWDEEDEEE